MQGSIVAALDYGLLDPAASEIPNVSPASLTFAATKIASSGNDSISIDIDLAEAVAALVDNKILLNQPFWVMSPSTALFLSMLRENGVRSYPNISLSGNSNLLGIPTIISSAAQNNIILIESSQVVCADSGILLDVSGNASLQMESAPDDPPIDSSVMVSLFQRNYSGLRAVHWVRWAARRTQAVSLTTNFGGGSGS
jgi:hypothetical protein